MAAHEEFQDLARDYFDHRYRLNPVDASWLGIHAYDDRLDDFDAGTVQDTILLSAELLERLERIDPAEL